MKRVLLIVMDGWGVGEDYDGNATGLADTPNIDTLQKEYPTTRLKASGLSVGLPEGQMGNSEVGHLTLGAGRVIFQELTRINMAIKNGEFQRNPVLTGHLAELKERGGRLHLMGLLSDGGVHSHVEHLYALLEAARDAGLKDVFIHAFMDGRDTPPESGINYIKELTGRLEDVGVGRIATITGRYHAMDRDRRWHRVERAYNAMVEGHGVEKDSPIRAMEDSYKDGLTDEFIRPVVIVEHARPVATVEDGDGVIFFNFRADRARELTRAFTEEDFTGFERRRKPSLLFFTTMTEYDRKFSLPVLFPPQRLTSILAEVLSRNGIRQFRVSETEKYAHVTFFFNGGVERPFEGEDRLLIPSIRDVATYDKRPEMRASEIADAVIERLKEDYGFILVNFANGDMVGHTGLLEAAVKACEAVDLATGRTVKEALKEGWTIMVTSDHGNVEQMREPATGEPHTAHTSNPVPFILVDDGLRAVSLREGGLYDVAPTVLSIMGLEIPAEMSGSPLF